KPRAPQLRTQSVKSGPRPSAARVRHVSCATLQKKFGHEHACNAESKLQPGVAETGGSFLHYVICHVERSRDISDFRRQSAEKQRIRDSSTSVGMTRLSLRQKAAPSS